MDWMRSLSLVALFFCGLSCLSFFFFFCRASASASEHDELQASSCGHLLVVACAGFVARSVIAEHFGRDALQEAAALRRLELLIRPPCDGSSKHVSGGIMRDQEQVTFERWSVIVLVVLIAAVGVALPALAADRRSRRHIATVLPSFVLVLVFAACCVCIGRARAWRVFGVRIRSASTSSSAACG